MLYFIHLTAVSRFSYGFVTNSRVKFIVVIDSSNVALRENEVRAVRLQRVPSTSISIYIYIYICFLSKDIPQPTHAIYGCRL